MTKREELIELVKLFKDGKITDFGFSQNIVSYLSSDSSYFDVKLYTNGTPSFIMAIVPVYRNGKIITNILINKQVIQELLDSKDFLDILDKQYQNQMKMNKDLIQLYKSHEDIEIDLSQFISIYCGFLKQNVIYLSDVLSSGDNWDKNVLLDEISRRNVIAEYDEIISNADDLKISNSNNLVRAVQYGILPSDFASDIKEFANEHSKKLVSGKVDSNCIGNTEVPFMDDFYKRMQDLCDRKLNSFEHRQVDEKTGEIKE